MQNAAQCGSTVDNGFAQWKIAFFGYFCCGSFLFEIHILLIYFYVEYLFNFFIKYLFNLVNVSTVFIPIK